MKEQSMQVEFFRVMLMMRTNVFMRLKLLQKQRKINKDNHLETNFLNTKFQCQLKFILIVMFPELPF